MLFVFTYEPTKTVISNNYGIGDRRGWLYGGVLYGGVLYGSVLYGGVRCTVWWYSVWLFDVVYYVCMVEQSSVLLYGCMDAWW